MSKPAATVSYAQNNEDIILRTILETVKKGFYVDVGANHPVEHSVTKIFYKAGWHGINVEPNPRLFELIQKDRPKDVNLNVGVANQTGKLSLRLYHSRDGLEGLSTFSEASKQENAKIVHEDNKNYSDISVPVQKLATILAKHAPETIHFMKVDVEGFEYDVLESNDWKRFRPHILCIEFNHLMKDWRGLLKTAQYDSLYSDGLNQYYVAHEVKDIYDTKDLIERIIIASTDVVKQREYELWQADKDDAIQLRAFAERQQAEIVRLNELVKSLEGRSSLSLKDQSLLKRIERAGYGLTIDWVKFKKNS